MLDNLVTRTKFSLEWLLYGSSTPVADAAPAGIHFVMRHNLSDLGLVQICSLEAAARTDAPNVTLWYYTHLSDDKTSGKFRWMSQFRLPNGAAPAWVRRIHVRPLSLSDPDLQTSFNFWIRQNFKAFHATSPVTQSDAYRLLVLQAFGGLYIDSDFWILNPNMTRIRSGLGKNGDWGVWSQHALNNDVLKFERSDPFLQQLTDDFISHWQTNLDANDYGYTAPWLVTRTYGRFDVDHTKVRAYGRKIFNPKCSDVDESAKVSEWASLYGIYGIHLTRRPLKKEGRLGTGDCWEKAMPFVCPATYASAAHHTTKQDRASILRFSETASATAQADQPSKGHEKPRERKRRHKHRSNQT